jgi:hypothetical protein
MTKDKVQRKNSVSEYWHFTALTCRVVRSYLTHTMHIQNHFNFIWYNMWYSVQWQFGNSILILLPLPGNLVVLSEWLHKQLLCWGRVGGLSHHYSSTAQILWHMSQRLLRCIHLCVRHQVAPMDPLDMGSRSALVIHINYYKSCLHILGVWWLPTRSVQLVEFCLFLAVKLLVYKMIEHY